MSNVLFVRNPDLKRLQDEGYKVLDQQGFLLVHLPYVNANREIRQGIIVSDLTCTVGVPAPPSNHQVWFVGDFPCYADGTPIEALRQSDASENLWDGFTVQHRFSNKPEGVSSFPDYYSKMTHYIRIISDQATAIDPNAHPQTFDVIPPPTENCVFWYWDSASSRANILPVTAKLAMRKIAIIGLGGSGSYVLDQVAKTPVGEIHLFDGDVFSQHNAFRSPGAASIADLHAKPSKVRYFANKYSAMHRHVIPHEDYVTPYNIESLAEFDFVFICVDRNEARNFIGRYLRDRGIAFIDVGLDLEHSRESEMLHGSCRATMVTPAKSDHFERHVALLGDDTDEDLYKSNIQVADMNALNAIMAVMMWKQHCGFYDSAYNPHHVVYGVNLNSMANAEMTAGVASLQ